MLKYKNYGRLWRVYGRSAFRYSTPKKVLNALRIEWAYHRRQANITAYPYLLNIEPLYYCNLECPLCDRQIFPEARKNDAGKLPLDIIDKLFDEVGPYLYQCQIFGQGEPLIDWPRTKYIIQQARSRHIFTLLSTNCTIMTPALAKEVIASGLNHLVCAIDGITQDSYSQYRVGGQVEKALETLRLFCRERDEQKSDVNIEWQFLVNRFNVHELEDARQMAEEIGVHIRFSPTHGMEFHPELQEYWLPETGDPKWQDGKIARGETRHEWPCYFLWRALIVNSNTQLARCLIYQNVAEYGSLRDHSVMELFNSPASQRARQLFSKKSVEPGDFPAPCNNCSFYKREHGGPNLDKHESLIPTGFDAEALAGKDVIPLNLGA
ncbi:MAG TPA: radical SAM/SPASM domain-containing protein [Abditibacterium sp.]|jgi:MoaA/NifB/PqqE/SkfB family radical SAM enzyme